MEPKTKHTFLETLEEVGESIQGEEIRFSDGVISHKPPLIGKIIFVLVFLYALPDVIKTTWGESDNIFYDIIKILIFTVLGSLLLAGIATLIIILMIAIFKYLSQ